MNTIAPALTSEPHEHWMRHALQLAQRAAAAGEVPVGAVVVKDGVVLGEGANAPLAGHDPTAHAEVLALRAAAQKLGNYRLEGCTLYVTLEPCTMCSGAMLHARIDTVVYGAAEPKTGAAGSVLNVFGYPQINHHTQVVRGVLADECAALLSQFFQERRAAHKAQALGSHPLKDTALRTPDSVFADLPDWPYLPQWYSSWAALDGLRMAVVDEGERHAPLTWLCVHGAASWGYAFRHLAVQWLQAGHRVVIPDLPGFGRSDQPKRAKTHAVQWHVQVLRDMVQALDLQRVVLVGEGDGARLGLEVAQSMPERFAGAWLVDTWPNATPPQPLAQWLQAAANKPQWGVDQGMEQAGFWPLTQSGSTPLALPFAQAGHRAALKAWPQLQAQLPVVPAPFLQQWLAQGRCWLTHSASNTLLPHGQWLAAWLAELSALVQYPGALWQTPLLPMVPEQAGRSAQQAVEYFAPSAKASVP